MKKLFAILFLTVFFVSFGAGYFLQPPSAHACWCSEVSLTCPTCTDLSDCTVLCQPEECGQVFACAIQGYGVVVVSARS